MPSVTYIEANGNQQEINVQIGTTLMQAAVDNMVEGIVAECGGSCSCATCHCYIEESWVDKVDAASEMENDLLTCVAEPKGNSRLSCQVVVTSELDGLVVHLPTTQF